MQLRLPNVGVHAIRRVVLDGAWQPSVSLLALQARCGRLMDKMARVRLGWTGKAGRLLIPSGVCPAAIAIDTDTRNRDHRAPDVGSFISSRLPLLLRCSARNRSTSFLPRQPQMLRRSPGLHQRPSLIRRRHCAACDQVYAGHGQPCTC
jgi:hypothetical protein